MFKNKVLIASCIFLLTILNIIFPLSAWANDKEKIIILYTNDVHCGVEDNIGLARLAQYKKDLLKITPYVALVDSGDYIQGASLGKLSKGESIINIMNSVGYDFAVPGNHEFDYGMERFLELAPKLNCGYYSSNLLDTATEKNILPSYKIMKFGKVKIAFIGVTTPESLTSSTPAFFQDDKENYLYTFCEDNTGEKLYKNIQHSVDMAKNEGADYIILVAHLGLNWTTPRYNSESIAKNTKDIDVIIDGHSHEAIEKYIVENKEHKKVIITQTGTKLQNIGEVTIDLDDKSTINSKLVHKLDVAIDKKVAKTIQAEKIKFEPILKQIIGKSEVDLISTDKMTAEQLVRYQETNLGDFVTDAYKNVLDSDVAICNGGGIRSEITQGIFTYDDILTSFPFGNMCVVLEVSGQQILDALELGASNYPKAFGGFLQVSGISYTIDSSIPSSVVLDEKGNFVKVNGKYRVQDVQINNSPLDINKKYTVAGTTYILKLGGNGMTMFNQKNSKIIQNETLSETDVIIEYLQNYLNANIGEEYANPKGKGRIKFK